MIKNWGYITKNFLIILLGIILIGRVGLFAQIPPPEKILGFPIGEDYRLADYEQALQYFRILAEASPKIQMHEMGKTGEGRPMIYAVITSESNMQQLDKYKNISRRLAQVESLSDNEAQMLAAEGKAVVWIDVGIHATECAPTQHAFQLAYDLISRSDSDTQFIMDNTIVLLVFANPDGMQMVADWYRRNLGTPYETSSLPWVYNRYVGHDNNRDSYMNNLVETRNITRLLNREWYPVILYDHHQTAPFPARIWIPPAAEPTNPNLHPLFIRGKNLIGSAMGYAFDREGKPGAISRFAFDFIYPGYEDSFGDFFHIISIMTETALYRYATPRFYSLYDFPEAYRDFTPSVFYPSPWKGGWWRLKDAVDYCMTASKSVLHTAALYRQIFLMSKYQMGKDVIRRFEEEPPYAWIIPQNQWDPPTAAQLVERMLLQGIKVYQADKAFNTDGVIHPAGTWIIPMNQPFALFVKTMFEEQEYPDLVKYPTQWQGIVRPQNFPDAYLPPYDMAGWSLPAQMGVKVLPAYSPVQAKMTPIETAELKTKLNLDKGNVYLLSSKLNHAFLAANRILKQGGKVRRTRKAFQLDGISYPAGTFVIPSQSYSVRNMQKLAEQLSIEIATSAKVQPTETVTIHKPNIALYRSWRSSMDEGWTRWLLEQYEFPYTNIHDAEIRAGALADKFDAIVIPSQSSNAIISGHAKGTMPPEYVGGIGDVGVRNLQTYVESGGTLIALNAACEFAIANFNLPVRNVLRSLQSGRRRYGGGSAQESVKFACPGSILRMRFDPNHAVAYGMPEEAPAVFYYSPAFQIFSGSSSDEVPHIIASYPQDTLLISGYLKGEEYLQQKASAVECALGQGRVILLGFGVQNRAQPHGTFKLLFNALFYAGSN